MRNIFILLLIGYSFLWAQEVDQSNLQKPAAQGADIAYALMNKGELVNCYMNFGQITDGYFQSTFYNYSWAKSKGIVAAGDAAVDDFSFMFARNGNVVDGFTAYRQEDWSPVPGSWGYYHAKNQPDELKVDGYPHLAVSDVPATWPEGYFDENGNWIDTPGEHHWPGKFRIDINPESPTYGQQIPGEFPADRVIFSAMDDHTNLQHPPMGVRLDVHAYEYGRSYAADFHFYEVEITNVSDSVLTDCWWGYYYDLDFGEYEKEAYYTYSSGLNPGEWDIIYELTPDDQFTDPNELEHGVFGVGFIKTPKDLGITDHHYYLDTGPTTDEQLWPLMNSNPNDPNIAGVRADYFHGSNIHLDDHTFTQTNMGYDWVCLTSTGPFDLQPGESVTSVVVVCAGDNVDDFKKNMDLAIQMYQKYYQGPSGPKAPKLSAVPGDLKVTLYWSDEPERTPDPYSGEIDFEGYQIFRSEDGGQTWGQEIRDGAGNLVGYVPVAQFDLKDDVLGLDPLNANFNLGNNTGIVHSWVDTDVKNGVEYSYTIIAYDRGDPAHNIPAFASSLGNSPLLDNFVTVTPEPRPLGYKGATSEVTRVSGYGKGEVLVDIVDPDALTDHEYHVTFVDSPGVHFKVLDATTGTELMPSYPINDEHMPVVDGFKVTVLGDDNFGSIKSVTDGSGQNVLGSENVDSTSSWYVKMLAWNRGGFEALTSDYEIRFTEKGSNVPVKLAKTLEIKEHVPFEVWNVTFNQQVTAVVIDKGGDLTYAEGEEIYIVNIPYDQTGVEIGQTFEVDLLNDVPFRLSVENAPSDSTNQPPLTGQVIRLQTTRAFVPSDRFSVKFTPAELEDISEDELKQIRVVPNPYVVNAPWERALNVREIQFMYLPPKCTISIYTTRGELVRKLEHNDNSGRMSWNLTSESNQDLAFGVYIYVVETPDGKQHVDKFALIK